MKRLLALAMIGMFAAVATTPALAQNKQNTKMSACQAQAGEKKLEGKDRQNFVSQCLKAKPAKPKSKLAECNAKTKGMGKEEAAKSRSECMKAPA